MNAEELLAAVMRLSVDERRKIYHGLRGEFAHRLETGWGLNSEAILEAIARAPDITQRGIRGVIAEASFVTKVLPAALRGTDWRPFEDTSGKDIPYDALIENAITGQKVRIQVKNQRRSKGLPMERKGQWIVEVQKTRSGMKGGKKTRPYQFTDFDLIAVCMYPSTGDWASFTYSLSADLKPRKYRKKLIETMQLVPRSLTGERWSTNLVEVLKNHR